MQEPLTGTATASLAGVSIVGLFAGLDAGVVIGAFDGAVVFVLSSRDIKLWHRWGYFVVSFIIGIYGADFVAGLLSKFVSDQPVDRSVGAMFASAGLVGVLVAISKPGSLTEFINKVVGATIDKFRGGGR
ncbi:putative holin [Morganella morganii]